MLVNHQIVTTGDSKNFGKDVRMGVPIQADYEYLKWAGAKIEELTNALDVERERAEKAETLVLELNERVQSLLEDASLIEYYGDKAEVAEARAEKLEAALREIEAGKFHDIAAVRGFAQAALKE